VAKAYITPHTPESLCYIPRAQGLYLAATLHLTEALMRYRVVSVVIRYSMILLLSSIAIQAQSV
jgi:hypothetical protein